MHPSLRHMRTDSPEHIRDVYSAMSTFDVYHVVVRSIRKLKVLTPRISESEFLGSSLWTWEFHPLQRRIWSESNPLKSSLVCGLAVA